MIKSRINRLRSLFVDHNVIGYIIPSNDEYMNEYVPESARRLEYITGFTGSNGIAVIGKDTGVFFTDGRYLEQSQKELDKEIFQIFDIKDISKFPWQNYIGQRSLLGYDPRLFTVNTLKLFSNLESSLRKIENNLIDQIWDDRPKNAASKVYLHDIEFAGDSHIRKIAQCRDVLTKHSADMMVITAPDSVCWLLNLRASDILYTPLMLAYALLTSDQIYLFIESERVNTDILQSRPEITILPKKEFGEILRQSSSKILVDENLISIHLKDLMDGKVVERISDPCQLFKACKNNIEIQHAVDFHIKDAVALCEFFAHLENMKDLSEQTEYDLGCILTEFRSRQDGYVTDSFPTICGFKENSAIIHYRAYKATAQKISGDGILLIDSGGQYLGATTDVTRTLILGTPTRQQKKLYTQVLKGHIALSTIKFPKNTVSGSNLDVLARQYLWQAHLDYPHGTGHGVGSFLSVHEGPASINLHNQITLQAGMILSNEPGHYIPDEFGIRIENLVYIKENDGWLEFENLTLIPYEKKLINYEMLNKDEIYYLDRYYKVMHSKIHPLLSQKAKNWLDSVRLTI